MCWAAINQQNVYSNPEQPPILQSQFCKLILTSTCWLPATPHSPRLAGPHLWASEDEPRVTAVLRHRSYSQAGYGNVAISNCRKRRALQCCNEKCSTICHNTSYTIVYVYVLATDPKIITIMVMVILTYAHRLLPTPLSRLQTFSEDNISASNIVPRVTEVGDTRADCNSIPQHPSVVRVRKDGAHHSCKVHGNLLIVRTLL